MNDSKSKAASTTSFFGRGQAYFSESIEEVKKVTTPTKQETIRLTWVVLLIIVVVALCLFTLDLGFNWIMNRVMSA